MVQLNCEQPLIMHEATPAYSVGVAREWVGGDRKIKNRAGGTGLLITPERAFFEMQVMAGVIIRAADYYHRGNIHDTVFDGSYINNGTSKTPQQFYNDGITNINTALSTADGTPECEKLKRAMQAVQNPLSPFNPELKHWLGTFGGPRTLNSGDMRIGFTDFVP